MSALHGAFEQGDRDIKLGKLNLADLPPLPSGQANELAAEPVAAATSAVPVVPAKPTPAHIAENLHVAPPAPPSHAQQLTAKAQAANVNHDVAAAANEASETETSTPVYSGPPPAALRSCILDLTEPIAKRTHAAFYLRTLGTPAAVEIILEALQQRQDSALMRHELAYICGQVGNPLACSAMAKILQDESDDVLVRHECAEALGAIGHASSTAVLAKYTTHHERDISETCQVAIDLIEYRNSPACAAEKQSRGSSKYLSVDPAPPYAEKKPVSVLLADLQNPARSLFLRYRAMFSLRDQGSDEAALALCQGLKDGSALFRHEIAYVLGQMQMAVTVDALAEVLRNTEEHRMVRHEAAEALGSIGGEDVEMILGDFLDDPEVVVTESCEVALDTLDYWEEFRGHK